MQNPPQQLTRALALHQSGNLAGAEQEYRRFLQTHPKHADALRMLGMLYLQQGQWEAGEKLTAQAIRSAPDHPEAHNNRGYALQYLGRNQEALDCYERAIQLYRAYPGAWYNRGNVLMGMKRTEEAIQSYRQALALQPAYADAWVNLGKALRALERNEEAATCYEQAMALAPNNAVAYNNYGNVLNELGRHEAALANFNRATALDPRYADAFFNAALVLHELERFAEALENCRKAEQLRPGHFETHLRMGLVLKDMYRFDEAMVSHEQAIALRPDSADAQAAKATLLIELGRMEEAEAVLQNALKFASLQEYAPLTLLRSLKRYRHDAALLAKLEDYHAQREALPAEKRISLGFAVGQAREDSGEYDRAFTAYAEANALHFQRYPYDEAADMRYIESTCSFFGAELYDRYLEAAREILPVHEERVPIFIVGMPRSGTTLIEQVLSSHSALYGAGELNILDDLVETLDLPSYTAPGWEHTLLRLRQLGEEYIEQVWKLAPDARYITDKMPHNFKHAGLIPLMLPNAKIIHAMRNPMDNCFSCYALQFQHGHYYSYDLGVLGRHYRRYRDMMEHWHKVLPSGRILDVRYEEMVADLEGQARRLLEYIGLPWDPACLKFYENKRAVSTASVTQVRQPIYSQSVARWKRFETHLDPLREIIGDLG